MVDRAAFVVKCGETPELSDAGTAFADLSSRIKYSRQDRGCKYIFHAFISALLRAGYLFYLWDCCNVMLIQQFFFCAYSPKINTRISALCRKGNFNGETVDNAEY